MVHSFPTRRSSDLDAVASACWDRQYEEFPDLQLWLVDDDEIRPEMLVARVQVDVWGTGGTTQETLDCKAIGAVLRSVARDLTGVWAGATISNAVAGQIIPSPDTTTGRTRFVVDLQIHLS